MLCLDTLQFLTKKSCYETLECQKRIDSRKNKDNPSVLIPDTLIYSYTYIQNIAVQIFLSSSIRITQKFIRINRYVYVNIFKIKSIQVCKHSQS